MDRKKYLPSSLRSRKRYIAFEIISERKVEFQDVMNHFWEALLGLLGELGASSANMWFIKDSWDSGTQRGLIRCDYMYTESVRASVGLIREFGGKKAIVHCLGISGTIKGARAKFFDKSFSGVEEK